MSDGQQEGCTGESFLDSITTVLKDSEGSTYEAGTDCGVEAKNLDTGKKASTIVDAGIYELTVTPKTFAFDSTSDNTIQLVVTAVDIDQLVTDVDSMRCDTDEYSGNIVSEIVDHDNGHTSRKTNELYVLYTGSDVEVPGILYGVYDSASGKWPYKGRSFTDVDSTE